MNIIKTLFVATALAFAGAAWAAPIDINNADAKTLEDIKGVGPAKAAAIVDYRTKNGPFKTVDELDKVSGIGKATVDKNRDNLVVSGGAPAKAEKVSTKKSAK